MSLSTVDEMKASPELGGGCVAVSDSAFVWYYPIKWRLHSSRNDKELSTIVLALSTVPYLTQPYISLRADSSI